MSSQISRSTTKAKLSIERAGYHIIKDAEHSKVNIGENESQRDMGKGRRFAQFYKEGYKTKTPNGLDFVYQNTIADEEIGPIVHSIIRQPRWGYLRFYSTKTLSADYAWFFRNHDEFNTDEPIQTLMVQFWLPGSRVVFYQGSQRQAFKAKEDLESFGIFRTPRSNMEKGDIVSAEEDMPNGG
ncbi:hypothetical protein MAC_02220 [Metarhizium acridum CQMa 102]|uniref:Uncharacterized protein n=1 Tax=Metarhizium acridum (strain CQMa 102) TaxID=655827 RepID=E9DX72_METAQ|nr:uncharacterized protein MAC_02220 [Metarhizium acridum CQMa 102]EFY91630.1 hypothetical protein MAC_02220 [Metarhizium acridum CQMa 102]